jgi:hypothetical protein
MDEIINWQTACSDSTELAFISLLNDSQSGRLLATVADNDSVYQFSFENEAVAAYQVLDEALLPYNRLIGKGSGYTFTVAESSWPTRLSPILAIFFQLPLSHYVIGTDFSCVEVLATSAPIVTQRTLQQLSALD